MSSPLDQLLHRHAAVSFEKQAALAGRVGDTPLAFDPDDSLLRGGELTFQAQVLGTADAEGFRWAWAKADAWPAESLRSARSIRKRAIDQGVVALMEPLVEPSVLDAQRLALLAVGMLDADGYLTTSEEGKLVYFLVKDPKHPREPVDPRSLRSVFDRLVQEVELPDHRRAFVEYLRARGVDVSAQDGHVVGLTLDGQTLVGDFDGKDRLTQLELRPDPPSEGFFIDSLGWEAQEGAVRLKVGALGVSPLGRLLRSRVLQGGRFKVCGPKGRTLEVVAHRKGSAVLAAEKDLRLHLDRSTTEDMLASMRPKCGVTTCPSLPGFEVEVVASEVHDHEGKLMRTLGWEPLPTPQWAIDPDELAATRAKSAGRAASRRRLACWLILLAPLLFPPALVAFASWFLRHQPYTIPEAYRAPPPGVGLALGTGLRLRYLGISGYELTDGKTVVLLDPVVTRPTIPQLISGPVESDLALVAPFRHADYILIDHAHHDHGIDAPAVALRTGATVLGSPSVLNLCRSRGVPEEQLRLAVPGERLQLGTFTVDIRAATHSGVLGISDPMSGTIPPDADALWFFQYTNDGGRSYRLEANGSSVWWHVSSHYDPHELNLPATTLIFGLAGEPMTAAKARRVIQDTHPRWVLPTHYDNFFQPKQRGLNLLPVIDVDGSVRLLREADPELKIYLLDYDQETELPPDY